MEAGLGSGSGYKLGVRGRGVVGVKVRVRVGMCVWVVGDGMVLVKQTGMNGNSRPK